MTTAATQYPLIGSAPVGNFFGVDTTQRHQLGTTIVFNDPYWGGGEAIYLQMPTSTALQVGEVLAYDTATSFVASAVANTANLGKSLAFLMNYVPSNASPQYAWAIVSGQCPVYSTASVAANTAFGIAAAGQAGANSAGKQILNARVTKPATTTVAKANTTTRNGSNIIVMPNTDGLFVGCPISGTGIPANTYIGAISPDNHTVLMTQSDLATAQNATATGSVTVTGTYNDGTAFWNVVTCDRPFAQGAIT